MKKDEKALTILHICDYAASYKGNFIESLEFLEKDNQNVKNTYLFSYRVRNTGADRWIANMNDNGTIAYIQEKNIVKNILLLKKIIKMHNVDFIFRHFSDYKMDVIIKLIFNSKRVVRFFHSMYSEEMKNLFKHFFKKMIWKKNILVGVSKAATQNLKQVFPKFSVHNIENAICFERLEIADYLPKNKEISLLVMGYNLEIKGTDLALIVTQKLREKYDVKLYILVAGHKENLVEYMNENFGSIPEWVTILPPIENIATYYNNSDIFLSPSRKEAFGYAVVEAAYCKKSIVASKVDGQAELEIDGVYWFESENIDDFYKKVELAIQQLDSEEIHLLKEKVKEVVQRRYSIERWRDEVVNLIKTDN